MNPEDSFPFLLQLLDDPSPVVQEEVRKALLPLAEKLGDLLLRYPASAAQREKLKETLFPWRRARLLSQWLRWKTEDSHESLGRAHEFLSQFGATWAHDESLEQQLGRFAQDCQQHLGEGLQAATLAEWLGARLKGDENDYYHPHNSLLSLVLSRGQGNPISLCSVLLLVGKRLGLEYWGVNYPGHFLASFQHDGETHYVDCFEKGELLTAALTPKLRGSLGLSEVQLLLQQSTRVEDIVQRILRNLVSGSLKTGQLLEANTYDLLLKDSVARSRGLGAGLALRAPLFCAGQVVRHKEKDYRGVIVDYELYQEQEDGLAYQPLYRILVHGSPQVAEAREESLSAENGRVAHPFLGMFFSRFENGVYIRNEEPWKSR